MNSRFLIPAGSTNVSEGLIQILHHMLEVDPSRRISCAEVWSLIDSLNDKHKDSQKFPSLI
jgi:hypothetical protein